MSMDMNDLDFCELVFWKVEFCEVVCEIVLKDWEWRKGGCLVDIGGVIIRVMEMVYKLGFFYGLN